MTFLERLKKNAEEARKRIQLAEFDKFKEACKLADKKIREGCLTAANFGQNTTVIRFPDISEDLIQHIKTKFKELMPFYVDPWDVRFYW